MSPAHKKKMRKKQQAGKMNANESIQSGIINTKSSASNTILKDSENGRTKKRPGTQDGVGRIKV